MENNKINIAEKLKNCPKGTKLYSSLFGKVELLSVDDDCYFPITVRIDEKKKKLASQKKDVIILVTPMQNVSFFHPQKCEIGADSSSLETWQ